MPAPKPPAGKARVGKPPAGKARVGKPPAGKARVGKPPAGKARVGDWVETHGLPGKPSRRGQIVELLGSAEHERFLVRWDERHESIVYPGAGVLVGPARSPRARSLRAAK